MGEEAAHHGAQAPYDGGAGCCPEPRRRACGLPGPTPASAAASTPPPPPPPPLRSSPASVSCCSRAAGDTSEASSASGLPACPPTEKQGSADDDAAMSPDCGSALDACCDTKALAAAWPLGRSKAYVPAQATRMLACGVRGGEGGGGGGARLGSGCSEGGRSVRFRLLLTTIK